MKVAQINKFGNFDVIEIVDIKKPKPTKGQILVKVFASSINPFDIKIREGIIPNMKFPFTLGSDVAGVVTEIGEEVLGFDVGNKVYGQGIVLAGASGAFAEFVVASADNIARMPKNLDFKQGAAMVLVGVSAAQAIIEHFNLQPYQKILIHGGSGGIGTIAIQLAKYIGAHVATTTTGDGINYVKKLGADEVIDYKNQNFEEILLNYDAVFDTVGGEFYKKSFKVLKQGGIIVSMVEKDNENFREKYSVTTINQMTKVNKENLEKLTKFIEENNIMPCIDKIYSFDKIKEAFDNKEKENVIGKIVIEIINN